MTKPTSDDHRQAQLELNMLRHLAPRWTEAWRVNSA